MVTNQAKSQEIYFVGGSHNHEKLSGLNNYTKNVCCYVVPPKFIFNLHLYFTESGFPAF